jgi:hypothetical protein
MHLHATGYDILLPHMYIEKTVTFQCIYSASITQSLLVMILFLDNYEILSSSKIKVLTLVRDCKSISMQLVKSSYSPLGIYREGCYVLMHLLLIKHISLACYDPIFRLLRNTEFKESKGFDSCKRVQQVHLHATGYMTKSAYVVCIRMF